VQIRTKLIFTFLAVASVGGVIGYVGYIGINDVFTIYDEIVDETAPELIFLGEIESLSHELQLEAISYVLLIQSSATDDSIQEELEEFKKTNIELDEVIFELREHEEVEEVEEMEFLEQVTVLKTRLYVTSLALIEEVDKGVSSQIIITMKEDLEQIEEELHEVIKIRIDLEKEELERQDTIADELASDTSDFIVIVSVIGIIFATSLGIFVSKTISTPISKLRNAAEAVDMGNLEVNIKPQGDDETNDLIVSFNSMTKGLKKTKELEAEKLKNEKINALGNVTSSLAHNLKNPLTVIKATTSIIESTSNSIDEKTQERLNLIKVSTENMLNQIEDILDFVKQKPLELKETSLSEILDTAIDNITIPERIKINLPENDIKIKCDSAKLQVVFMNMITNSIESVQVDGEITIEGYQNKRETTIEITDTGSINPNDLEKVFDVLFTTKPTGTGLGLPYCKNVIEQHGGNLEVSMNPTKFTIIIPRLD